MRPIIGNQKGWQGGEDITETSIARFKAWQNSGETTKPVASGRPGLAKMQDGRAVIRNKLSDTSSAEDKQHLAAEVRDQKKDQNENEYAQPDVKKVEKRSSSDTS
jgi:hypothetical protein